MSGCQRQGRNPTPGRLHGLRNLAPGSGALPRPSCTLLGRATLEAWQMEPGQSSARVQQRGQWWKADGDSGLHLVRNPVREWRMFAKSQRSPGTSPGAITSHWPLFANDLVCFWWDQIPLWVSLKILNVSQILFDLTGWRPGIKTPALVHEKNKWNLALLGANRSVRFLWLSCLWSAPQIV